MPHSTEYSGETGIIHIRYLGNVTLDDRLNIINELCVDFRQYLPFKLAINVSALTYQLTQAEQEILGKYIAEREELLDARVAVIPIRIKNWSFSEN